MAISAAAKQVYDKKRYEKKQTIQGKPKKVFFSIRLSENQLAQASRIAAEAITTGKYAWKTTAEVLRAMIGLGFKHLEQEGDEDVAGGNQLLMLEQRAQEFSRVRRTMHSVFDSIKVELDELVKMGNLIAAAQIYAATMDDMDRVDRTPWSDWLHKELKGTYPQLDELYENDEIPSSSVFKRREGRRGSKKRAKMKKKAQARR